jgi:hypothetical protein
MMLQTYIMTNISVFTLLYRKVIEFGECIGNCLDIQQSFADGMCLDNVFMQCFIQCFRDEDLNHCPSINKTDLYWMSMLVYVN